MPCPICGGGPCIRRAASSSTVMQSLSSEYNFVGMSDTFRSHRVSPLAPPSRASGHSQRPHGSMKIGKSSNSETYFTSHRTYLTARKEAIISNTSEISQYREKYISTKNLNPRLNISTRHDSVIGFSQENGDAGIRSSRFSLVYNKDNDSWYELTGFPKSR